MARKKSSSNFLLNTSGGFLAPEGQKKPEQLKTPKKFLKKCKLFFKKRLKFVMLKFWKHSISNRHYAVTYY